MPLHHCQVIREHLIWGTKPQAVFDVVIGFLLVDRQLLSAVLQAEHSQVIVKPLLVDAVLAFHLCVVARCCNADAVVEDINIGYSHDMDASSI